MNQETQTVVVLLEILYTALSGNGYINSLCVKKGQVLLTDGTRLNAVDMYSHLRVLCVSLLLQFWSQSFVT